MSDKGSGARAPTREGRVRAGAVASVVVTCLAAAFAVFAIAVLICTLASGYPNIFGKGCFVHSAATGSELPDETFVLFDPCGAEDVEEGEFAVFRLVRGIGTGRVERAGGSLVVSTGRDRLMSVPASAVLGRATGHIPALGKAVSALAAFDIGGTVLGVFFAASAGISLIVGLHKQALPEADPYVREKRR